MDLSCIFWCPIMLNHFLCAYLPFEYSLGWNVCSYIICPFSNWIFFVLLSIKGTLCILESIHWQICGLQIFPLEHSLSLQTFCRMKAFNSWDPGSYFSIVFQIALCKKFYFLELAPAGEEVSSILLLQSEAGSPGYSHSLRWHSGKGKIHATV